MDVPVDAQELALPPIEAFKNCQYHVRVSGTTVLDKRIMSFVDNLWGFEVTGGVDQFEPLTVIAVKREGLARRAGIRVNDVITKINETYADKLTLAQAQELIAESGRTVKIFVRGDVEEESEDEMTVDYWFQPLSDADRSLLDWEARMRANRNPDKWNGLWPWNDRRKVIYKESNCYMVPSVAEDKRERELKLRVSEMDYKKHLVLEKEEAERKAEEQRQEEAKQAEKDRRAEEEAFFAKFEAEQKRLEEQNPQQAAETDQYIEELMQQEKLLAAGDGEEVSTDFPAEIERDV
ncbi:golgin subfamily A member 6-like protein 26 isoform X2 [Topomyia yanbarensis]|uniref:golgin subfamily A member 6-like protein 26 isoform X2 n=1 Tax=Topomyia yanbarensis TaxID=2498891 RepID=UPI00273C138A|nr:golgin subfamily A member 6-like protein 26 isoform X2 [Topomyia yanbarensis]